MTISVIDFDEIETWGPQLSSVLDSRVPPLFYSTLTANPPEYVEDARDILFATSDADAVIDATLAWIRSAAIVGYHGSRLTTAEVQSILQNGLIPLSASGRRERIVRALSSHPNWEQFKDKVDFAIKRFGEGEAGGRREGQVHLTLSRAGLTNGFNHYLKYGAEFDQHVVHDLVGEGGYEFLMRDGEARLFKVAVPGQIALEKTHVYFSIDETRLMNKVPNLVGELLEAWSYRQFDDTYQPSKLRVDCGMIFRESIDPGWILGHETLSI